MRNLTSAGRLIALPFLLLAVMVQVNAVVRSLVMRATPMAQTPFCSAAMAGMGGQTPPKDHRAHAKAPRGACPFCDVASHVPVFMATPPVPPCQTVAFIAFDRFPDRPVREPPAILARARDPPLFRPT